METWYHGSDSDDLEGDDLLTGLCFTDDPDVAREYGPYLYSIRIDTGVRGGLELRDVDGYVDHGDYICDSIDGIERLANEGLDVVTHDTVSPRGRSHRTLCIVSDKALAVVAKSWKRHD